MSCFEAYLSFDRKSFPRTDDCWEPARPLQTYLERALRAPNAKKVSKMSPGDSGRGTPKSLLGRVVSECSRDFLETFRDPRAGVPGRHVRDFFGISGERPRDVCKGRRRKGQDVNSCNSDHPRDCEDFAASAWRGILGMDGSQVLWCNVLVGFAAARARTKSTQIHPSPISPSNETRGETMK